MIYMVEMNLIDLSDRPDWDNWYLAHTKMLLSFPGFHATQRFECIHEAKVPFVALHHVDGIDFFDSHSYKTLEKYHKDYLIYFHLVLLHRCNLVYNFHA